MAGGPFDLCVKWGGPFFEGLKRLSDGESEGKQSVVVVLTLSIVKYLSEFIIPAIEAE